jgi:hypothetical protein
MHSYAHTATATATAPPLPPSLPASLFSRSATNAGTLRAQSAAQREHVRREGGGGRGLQQVVGQARLLPRADRVVRRLRSQWPIG